MTIFDQFSPENALLDVSAKTRGGVLDIMAAVAAERLGMSGADISQALEHREALGSTALGKGVALPHAPLPGASTSLVLFARLPRKVDFEARDGEGVDLVFLLLCPQAATKELLSAMAEIAWAAREPGLLRSLRLAESREQVADLLRRGTAPPAERAASPRET